MLYISPPAAKTLYSLNYPSFNAAFRNLSSSLNLLLAEESPPPPSIISFGSPGGVIAVASSLSLTDLIAEI